MNGTEEVHARTDYLGFRIGTAEEIQAAVLNEAQRIIRSPALAEEVVTQAVNLQSAIFVRKLHDRIESAKTDAELQALRNVFVDLGLTCLHATKEPVFAGLVEHPVDFDLDKAATDAIDSLLEDGGLASWQTPKIQLRGDLLYVAAACVQYIGGDRLEELRARYGRSDDARERSYYTSQIERGLVETRLPIDSDICSRFISKLESDVKVMGNGPK